MEVIISRKSFYGGFWRLFYYTAASVSVSARVAAVKRLPVLHYSADYIAFPLGSLGLLWYIWKWSSAHVYARGHKQCCKLYSWLWRVSVKPRLPFSNLQPVLCIQRQSFDVYFTTLQLVLVPCCCGRRSPRTYIAFLLGSLWYVWNGVLLMYTLKGVSCAAYFITAYIESQ